MQNEEASRRPDFLGGLPVELADGNPWYIPVPMIELRPKLLESIDGRTEALTTFGLPFDRLVATVGQAKTIREQARALLALAVDLLGRNYDLTPDEFRELLRYDIEDQERNESLLMIYRIASGEGPRTLGRWARLGAILAGADPDRLPLADALDLAAMQVSLGRLVPADRWVDDLAAARNSRNLDSLGAC